MTQNNPIQETGQRGLHPSRLLRSTSFHLFGIVFIVVLTFYLLTLAPGVVGGDAGEHQFAAPLLGIPHTTGYPLYTLLGKLWTLLIPSGALSWRMNLLSAVGGALAAATTTLVVYRLSASHPFTPANRTPPVTPPAAPWAGALVAGLALSLGLSLWQWGIIAGVRSINILFFALLTLEAIIWQQQRQRGDIQAAERTLRWLALTVGLSLAHHRTTVFYLPSLVGWIWYHDRKLVIQFKRVLTLLALSIIPLFLYLFIYIRGINNPPYSHEPISDLSSFWFLIGSGDSTGRVFSIDPAFLPSRLAFIWQDILAQLSLPGVILAGFGGLLLLWQQTKHFVCQGLLVLILLLFTIDFEINDLTIAPTWYLMPAYFIFAVWLGVGINGILDFSFWIYAVGAANLHYPRKLSHAKSQRAPRQSALIVPFGYWVKNNWKNFATFAPWREIFNLIVARSVPRYDVQFDRRAHPTQNKRLTRAAGFFVAAITLAILAYALAWPNWQQIYTESTRPLDEWRQLLRGSQAQRFVNSSLPRVEANSIIWGDWEQYTPLKYYQLIEGTRPDVTVRNPLDQWPQKLAAARAAGRPFYLTRKTTDLIGTPHLSMVGPLIHLRARAQLKAPDDVIRLNANFEDELELIGYRAAVIPQNTPGGAQAGDIIQLMLYWRVPHQVGWDYSLSLRLLDSTGREIYRRDAAHPVLGSYPTTLWTPGEVVGDFYELPFPPGTGPLTLHLLPYRTEAPGQWHNLTLGAGPSEGGILLGPFESRH